MANSTETVTIEKNYLETLLRRAQFHTSNGVEVTSPYDGDSVTIKKSEHNVLLQHSCEYENLRRNLYKGGIAEETLNILIKDDTLADDTVTSTVPPTIEEPDNSTAFMSQMPLQSTKEINGQRAYTCGTPRNSSANLRPRDLNNFQSHSFQYQNFKSNYHTNDNDDFSYSPDAAEGYMEFENVNHDSQPKYQRPTFEKFAQRTVQLINLAEGTTHLDVVDAVRGGLLLDIYLRSHDRTASVSFLEQAHAQEYFRYVKRNDLYIRGKRVDIRWNDRQFILPGHVANKVAVGATRNLVIRHCAPRHTEEVIRDDLEHIHNLVVIKVSFSNGDAFISTNSVHNAMFARTCMMSRSTYKGSKIDWDNDESAGPLEKRLTVRSETPVARKKASPIMNRFQLLNMDGDEDSDTEGAPTEEMVFPAMTSRATGVVV